MHLSTLSSLLALLSSHVLAAPQGSTSTSDTTSTAPSAAQCVAYYKQYGFGPLYPDDTNAAAPPCYYEARCPILDATGRPVEGLAPGDRLRRCWQPAYNSNGVAIGGGG